MSHVMIQTVFVNVGKMWTSCRLADVIYLQHHVINMYVIFAVKSFRIYSVHCFYGVVILRKFSSGTSGVSLSQS